VKIIPQCSCLLIMASGLLLAQSKTAAELGGAISDPSGALVPGAQLSVTNRETGDTRTLLSDSRGQYRFLSLVPGTYDITTASEGFRGETRTGLVLTVGQVATLDFQLTIGVRTETIDVVAEALVLDPERSHQANTIVQNEVKNLPINRRDYLTFTLLAPGIADSQTVTDANTFRVKQTPTSGLSFYGSNGRGNSISVDGGESNDAAGGVRPTVSQETVQEFQIDRTNYSAEYGAARGGVINIITKSGSNALHGSIFGFFRNQSLDAANPFAITLQNGALVRVKPDSSRQQFGGSFGGPIAKDRTFYFLGYEQLRRNEAATVPLLTDFSIFQPTAAQAAILGNLPPEQAAPLRTALTSPPSTVSMFEQNSGVFPFRTRSHQGLWRIDHHRGAKDQVNLRFNVSKISDTNPNVAALVGISRGYVQDFIDTTGLAAWFHTFSPYVINEARAQFNYDDQFTGSYDPHGPAIEIAGFGSFNRDFNLPSNTLTRRTEFIDNLNILKGSHNLKLGAMLLVRQTTADTRVLSGGRFTFGTLPGAFVSAALASTTINSLQAFNLGLAQSYQQGFGEPVVSAVYPLYAGYVQDVWKIRRNLTLNLGLRYEVDQRKSPLPTNKHNFAPRFGFAWDPGNDRKTVVRGGYGLFYATIDFQIDFVANALNEINGYRQLAQVLSVLSASNPLAVTGPINIFKTLRGQGVIGIPTPQRSIQEQDLQQFGIQVSHTGPLPPLSVLFRNSPDYTNPYAQQASFEIERQLGHDFTVSAGYIYVRGVHLTTSRDVNLLQAPVNPLTGIRDWGVTTDNPTGTKYFKNPLVLQENVYESTANSWFHGMTIEAKKRFRPSIDVNFNYTFSKAIDETVDFNSDFQPNDQTCRSCERALSSFDQRHKIVLYAVLQAPAQGYGSGIGKLASGFSFSPIFRYNSARPFNLLAGRELNNDRHNTTDRPFLAGRNTGIGPTFWTFDARLSRSFRFGDATRLDLMFEAFNLFNRLNYASVNNVVGNISGPFRVTGRDDRTPSEPLGFTSVFDPRRIQLGLRMTF